MSRDIFGEEMASWGRREKNTYVPGTIGYDEELVDALATFFLTEDRYVGTDHYEDFLMESLPFPDSEFDMNLHLSMLVQKISQEADSDHLHQACSYLSVVLQSAFYLGHNDFILEIGSLAYDYERIIHHLMGSEDESIRIMVSGNATSYLDSKSYYLSVVYHGKVDYVGIGAKYCDYDVKDSAGNNGKVGRNARRSTFTVDSVDFIPGMDPDHRTSVSMRNCSYRVRETPTEEEIETMEKRGFFLKENKLFVPKDEDWQEVFRL